MGYKAELVAPPRIEQAILLIRGQRVMLDRDLAAMYGVSTGNLNKAVRRNLSRFPADFMFQLTEEEAEASRFQIGILKRGLNFNRPQEVWRVTPCAPRFTFERAAGRGLPALPIYVPH
ncbi:MAG: ORF6N domain-containing protein [Limisphaerales bacterium]